jgi:hypothetical protein
MGAIRKHIDFEIAILHPEAVFINAPIRLSVRIMAAIIPLQILVANLCEQCCASILDCVDIGFRESKVGPNCATVGRHDGVFMPVSLHIRVHNLIARNLKIDILILEFTIMHANCLTKTLLPVFLRAQRGRIGKVKKINLPNIGRGGLA